MRQRILTVLLVAWTLATVAQAGVSLTVDAKRHGPLDRHPALVLEVLSDMSLPAEQLAKLAGVARKAQNDWRAWSSRSSDRSNPAMTPGLAICPALALRAHEGSGGMEIFSGEVVFRPRPSCMPVSIAGESRGVSPRCRSRSNELTPR